MSKRIFVSGRPGVGKTTVFFKVINEVKRHGLSVGGFVCPEVRVKGRRIGFDIIDIRTGRRGRLARLCSMESFSTKPGLRVGRYCIIPSEAEDIGVKAIETAMNYCDIVAIDEIGPMELKVPRLREVIGKALTSEKTVFAVVHRSIASRYSTLYKAKLLWIDESNREHIHREIINLILRHL